MKQMFLYTKRHSKAFNTIITTITIIITIIICLHLIPQFNTFSLQILMIL